MKKFTFMLMAAFVAVFSYAGVPAGKALQRLQAPAGTVLQGLGKVQAPRAINQSRSAMRKAASDYVVITSQPEGELKSYVRGGNHYVVQNQSIAYGSQSGAIDIVFAADKKVYFKDIVSGLPFGTWVEGTLSDDGTTITVPLGQNIRYVEQYDACIAIQMIDYESGVGFAPNFEKTEATFTIDDEGVISLQGTGFTSSSLGAAWTDDKSIQDYGDYESVYTEYTPNTELVTPPDGLVTEDMPMVGADADQNPIEATVKVGLADGFFYIQGLVQDMPEAWVKGELGDDNTVEIPVTYLGENEGTHYYATGYNSGAVAPIYMTYNPETKSLAVDGYVLFNRSEMSVDFVNYYMGLFIGTLPELVTPPADATVAQMPITGVLNDGEAETPFESVVNVVVSGNDVYFQGIINETPEGWIKGSFNEDGLLVFPTGQYTGLGTYGPTYAVGGSMSEEVEGAIDISFTYDEKKNLYASTGIIYSSLKQNDIYYSSALYDIKIGVDCDELWIAKDQGYENQQAVTDFTIGEGINVVFDNGGNSNVPKYYTSGEALRMYANNTMTITSEKAIGKIEFTMTGGLTQRSLTANVGEYALSGNVGTWTGEANEIVFTVPSTSGSQARIQKITIWYFDASTQTVTVPEDLVAEPYLFQGHDTYYDEDTQFNVKVGFKDNKVYFQGLSQMMPEAWVSGTLADGKVTIPNWYLGVYESLFGNYDILFSGATFDYDAEANQFTCEEGYQTYAGTTAMDEYSDVVITKLNETEATPADPSVSSFTLYNEPQAGDTELSFRSYPSVSFAIPALDKDENALIEDKLSYVIWIEDANSQQSELTLTADLYEYLTEDMTEIPYAYTDDYDIYVGGSRVYLNQEPTEIASWKKIGVQSIYRGMNIEHRSNIGWFDIAAYKQQMQDKLDLLTGISSVAADKSQKTVIYNLAGQRVANPAKGLYIVNGKKIVLK